MRTVILKQTGYEVSGVATIHLWSGRDTKVEMNKSSVPLGKITKDTLLKCINDGGFGCECILSATVYIWDVFENGYEEFNRSIHIPHPKAELVQRGCIPSRCHNYY